MCTLVGLQVQCYYYNGTTQESQVSDFCQIFYRSIEGRHVPLDDPSVSILIINSGVKHQLSGSEYPLRRAQCEQVAKTLNAQYLRDVSRKTLEGG